MRLRRLQGGLLAVLIAIPAAGQLPRPTRTDQANNHLRIKEWMYEARIGRTVTVATTGGDYSTLAAAVSYVTTQTPSAVAPWVILIYDGDHSAAPVPLPPWVSAIFLGGIDDDGDRSGLAVRTGTGYDWALKITGTTNIAGGGGAGNYFETVNVPAGTDPVADGVDDTLNITCTGGLTCTGTAATDTIDFALPADDDTPEAGEFGALALTGPVTSSGLATTIASDAVALGTQTTGGYAASATEAGAASSVADDSVALTTNTTGSYVSTATTSQGLTVTGTEGASVGLQDCAATEVLKRNGGDTAWECAADATGAGIGGSTGATDNAALRADGTGGATLQTSGLLIDDNAVAWVSGVSSAVNGVKLVPAITGTGPTIVSYGADSQVDLTLETKNNGTIFMRTNGSNRAKLDSSGWQDVTVTGFRVRLGGGTATFMPNQQDSDTGLGDGGADAMIMTAGNQEISRFALVGGVRRETANGQRLDAPQAATCADSGDGNPGALTIAPVASLVYVTVNDADGCTFTLSETGVTSGVQVELITVTGSGTYSDTAGVTELAGAFVAGQNDSLTLRYIADRWVESARSNN